MVRGLSIVPVATLPRILPVILSVKKDGYHASYSERWLCHQKDINLHFKPLDSQALIFLS